MFAYEAYTCCRQRLYDADVSLSITILDFAIGILVFIMPLFYSRNFFFSQSPLHSFPSTARIYDCRVLNSASERLHAGSCPVEMDASEGPDILSFLPALILLLQNLVASMMLSQPLLGNNNSIVEHSFVKNHDAFVNMDFIISSILHNCTPKYFLEIIIITH